MYYKKNTQYIKKGEYAIKFNPSMLINFANQKGASTSLGIPSGIIRGYQKGTTFGIQDSAFNFTKNYELTNGGITFKVVAFELYEIVEY